MTPEQKRLVRDTWKQVAPVAEAAAGMLYHRLFEIDPTTRKLFPRDRYGGATQKAVADVGLRHQWPGQSRRAGNEGRRSRPPSRPLWRHRRAIRFRGRCAVMDAGTGSRSGVDASRGVGVERS